MSKCEDAPSTILQLRALREKLCGKEKEWKNAFEIRDVVVQKIVEVHAYASADNAEIHIVHEQLECILNYLQVPLIEPETGE